MGFNFKVILHIGGLLATMVLLTWVWQNTNFYATKLTLGLVFLLQVFSLIKLVNTTNREVSRFLLAVKYADFSQSFRSQGLLGSFNELGAAFDDVIARFRSERGEKEEHAAWLQSFVQQLPIAVLAIHDDGRIAISNHALQRLLNGRQFQHLSQLTEYDPSLGAFIADLAPGREHAFKLKRPYGTLQLKVTCTWLRQRGQQQKLISLLDISSELESQELEAWHNLIRVMTHEIMNSLTPLTSLADTARSYVDEAQQQLQHHELASNQNVQKSLPLLEDASSAVATISKRSQGLLRFVQSYRALSRLPTPRMQTFKVQELIQRVAALMQKSQEGQSAVVHTLCSPSSLELNADPELLEQALINLVRNALDAVSATENPQITLSADLRERGQIALTVQDNGCGMDADTLANMFVPFFTTKRGGSGIGMTLVRQIVHVNKGSIQVESLPGQGATITLLF